VRDAFYRARRESRPIVLCVPLDVQRMECEGDGADYRPSSDMFAGQQAIRPDLERLHESAGIIKKSKKPVIVLGRGAMSPAAQAAANRLGERIGALVAKARRHLQSLKLKNVSLKHGDGSHDLGEDLAVDAIVITAGATHVPTPLLRYLKPGGRMVLPLAQPNEERGVQRLTVLEASAAGLKEHTLDAVRFVPLLSGLA
jgi:threonine dehydrogenase-like Zn-dependent dehydrogenase